jgi:DNA-binding transcriptional MerR regulator
VLARPQIFSDDSIQAIRVNKSEASLVGMAEREAAFEAIERAHPTGMSVQQIVQAMESMGEKLTEATFRKYVQLGLLPRSVRVGRKGKHQGSQGLYPASSVRQVQMIRGLMTQGFTIEEIQSRFLFVGGEIDALSKEIHRLMEQLERAQGSADSLLRREIEDARRLAGSLVEKLRDVERHRRVSFDVLKLIRSGGTR